MAGLPRACASYEIGHHMDVENGEAILGTKPLTSELDHRAADDVKILRYFLGSNSEVCGPEATCVISRSIFDQ